MRAVKRSLLALAASLALSGCASAFGTLTEPKPYIGVVVAYCGIADVRPGWSYRLTALLLVLDLPGTVLLDTLLLPYTILASSSS